MLVRLRRRTRRFVTDVHDHHHDDHPHEHHHDADAHSHGGRTHSHAPIDVDRLMGWRGLVALGFAGGLVPSPSALVVLLGAIALGRTWFGLVLVIGYGVGMAATLTAAGLLLVRARNFIDRRARRAGSNRLFAAARLLPTATSSLIVVVGVALALRAAAKL